MTQYISKSAVVAEIEKRRKEWRYGSSTEAKFKREECDDILSCLDTLEVKESNETAEAFARIIRGNLSMMDKSLQYKFEQLYKEITGKKMYQGYND